MPTRRRILALLTLPLASPGHAAEDPRALPGDLYAADPHSGLALDGLDPVSYFLDPTSPRAGDPALELGHAGLVWRFAGRGNREAFRADPETYVPRIGGYDPVGAARGRVVNADPRIAALIDGRLYLFRVPEGRERALSDPAMLAEAEARWPQLKAGR